MGYQTVCLDTTKQYVIYCLQHKFIQEVQSKDPYFYLPKCWILRYIAQMDMEWIKFSAYHLVAPRQRVWYPTTYTLMKKMSTSYRGWTVLFENLNGLGGPLNKLFTKNPFAQPIFRPKDNPFSPRQVLNQKSQNFGTP